MGAYVVVFHPGFYGKDDKINAFRKCKESLKDVVRSIESIGIRNVMLGPETMGKNVQLCTLNEVLEICEEIEKTQPVIDWSHLHARDMGRLKTRSDSRRVIVEIENRLGILASRNIHCHFTKIEFTERGERRHHVLDDTKFGPDYQLLAEVISEFKLRLVIVCETPLLDIDAIKMKDKFLDLNRDLVRSLFDTFLH